MEIIRLMLSFINTQTPEHKKIQESEDGDGSMKGCPLEMKQCGIHLSQLAMSLQNLWLSTQTKSVKNSRLEQRRAPKSPSITEELLVVHC